MKARAEMSVDLRVVKVGDDTFSTMLLEFPEGHDRVIHTFDPDRLYLEDTPGADCYGLIDSGGHRYCGIERHAEWTEAAEGRGIFFLVMQSELDTKRIAGRILIVRYPFGKILRDTEVFQIDTHDFNRAIYDGQLIRRAIQGIKVADLKSCQAS
jgi:hypothetical protein